MWIKFNRFVADIVDFVNILIIWVRTSFVRSFRSISPHLKLMPLQNFISNL